MTATLIHRLAAVALAVTVGAATGCVASRQQEEPAVPSHAFDDAAIPNLRQPRAGLLTGGQPAPRAWAALQARGVTTVVNLRTPAEMAGRDEAGEVAAAGMAYHAIPVDGLAGIDEQNARALWALVSKADGGVLVHCASGNRVGALLALGAAASGEMPVAEALDFGRAAGLSGAEPRVRELLDLPAE